MRNLLRLLRLVALAALFMPALAVPGAVHAGETTWQRLYVPGAPSIGPIVQGLSLPGCPNGASVSLNFATGQYCGGSLASMVSLSRASSGTNLRPTSPSGFAYSTWGSNVPRIDANGFLIEEARTNVLLNSTVPVTQTTASLAAGTYTLWVNGAGSAAVSAGTATITGAGTATNGTPVTFVVTVAGTVTVTVSGSLNAFQLELGAFGTSLIVTAGASASRAADIPQLIGPALAAALNAKAAFFQTFGVAGITGGVARLFNFGGGARLAYTATTQATISAATGAAIQGNFGAQSTAVIAKLSAGFDQSGLSLIINNGPLATNAVAWSGNTGADFFGNASGGTQALNGYMQRIALSSIKGQFDGMTAP